MYTGADLWDYKKSQAGLHGNQSKVNFHSLTFWENESWNLIFFGKGVRYFYSCHKSVLLRTCIWKCTPLTLGSMVVPQGQGWADISPRVSFIYVILECEQMHAGHTENSMERNGALNIHKPADCIKKRNTNTQSSQRTMKPTQEICDCRSWL